MCWELQTFCVFGMWNYSMIRPCAQLWVAYEYWSLDFDRAHWICCQPTHPRWRYSLQAGPSEWSRLAFNSHFNSNYPLLSSSGMSWKETQHQASLLVNFSGLNQVEGQWNCPEGTYCIFSAIGWDFFCTAQKYIQSSCHPFTCTSLCEKDLYDWPKWGSPASLSAVLLSLPPFIPLLCFYPSWLPSSIAHAICLYPWKVSTQSLDCRLYWCLQSPAASVLDFPVLRRSSCTKCCLLPPSLMISHPQFIYSQLFFITRQKCQQKPSLDYTFLSLSPNHFLPLHWSF